ncbi:MAG: GNAT family N-acetyltransferase [Promethearchaeota archaeon]
MQSYQRTLFLFQDEKELKSVFGDFLQHCIESEYTGTAGLIVIDNKTHKTSLFQDLNQLISSLSNVKINTFDVISSVLGQTLDFLLLDLRENFVPNTINIVLETVRGGGVIFLLGLPYSEWVYSVNKNQILLKNVPSTKTKHTKSILLDWFLKNILNNPQCRTKGSSSSEIIESFNPMPYQVNLTTQIKDIHVTPEQKNVIKSIVDTLLDTKHPNSCSILVANRGRGKSASIGLSISQVLSKQRMHSYKVVISSPHLTNVQTLFEFLSKGLTSEEVIFHELKQDSWVSGIKTSSGAKITYLWPSEISKNLRTDLFVVDEAAAIPVEILKEIIKVKAKKIFVSTIHGYEGAGRGFQHKFLPYLRKQKGIQYSEFSLHQPIRYLSGDSIEKLLNNTFLLNVELDPSEMDYKTLDRESFGLKVYKNIEYLFSEQGLPYLKQLFSLLIYAHYRNQPNDLLVLADSGKHFLTGVYGKDRQQNKLLLVSSQLAKEGEMTEKEISKVASGKFIKGNLISTIAIRHFSKEFAKLCGLRIVRIAAHPSLMNKGFGRLTIELQQNIFSSYDWIGVSYGATVKLMKFWRKFGFKSVHIRPIKTPETGEWNIVVIHPLSPPAATIINQVSSDFLLQFLALLKQSLHSMIPELAIQILKSCSPIPDYKPKITSSGAFRLNNYLDGHLNFLLAVDVIYELTVKYFVSPNTIKLSPIQEVLMITRILQGRTWGQTLSRTGLNWKTANTMLKKAVVKIARDYV